MPRCARTDSLVHLDLTALAPHGVVRAADLVAAGVPPDVIQSRCVGRRWHRLGPGLIRVASAPSAPEQLLHAALLYGGPGALVTGVHALHRYGLTRRAATGAIRVLVPSERRRRGTPHFLVERTERLPPGVLRDGLCVAPVERAVLDLARTLTDRDEIRAVVAEPVQRGRTTAARLETELAAGSQRGTAFVRRVLRDVHLGIRSTAEGWALDVHRAGGLPPARWNPRLYLPGGRFLASPDAFFEDVGLAWEIDSKEFHFTPEEWEATLRRRTDMTNAQLVVVHHSPRALRERPRAVVDDLWGAYRLAASRPRPDIRVR